MQFHLNEEQSLLQESLRRFLDNEYGFEYRQSIRRTSPQGLRQNWRVFAENGWLAVALPESVGGFGGSIVETLIIAHEFGRVLVIEPYIGCAVLGAQTLLASGDKGKIETFLPEVAQGRLRIALAYDEPGLRGLPGPAEMKAKSTVNGYLLNGKKLLVIGAVDADKFIVSTRLEDSGRTGLFLVDADTPDLERIDLPLHDGTVAQELVFKDVHISQTAMIGNPDIGLQILRSGYNQGVLAICASMIGAMERAIEITSEYLRTRQQFGQPISSFQVLQHRMADMATEMELARSMLFSAMAAVSSGNTAHADQSVSFAKSLIGRSAKFVCGQAIQLHGGIGMTEEYVIGHYFKYAMVANALLGSSSRHDEACAAQLEHQCLEDCLDQEQVR